MIYFYFNYHIYGKAFKLEIFKKQDRGYHESSFSLHHLLLFSTAFGNKFLLHPSPVFSTLIEAQYRQHNECKEHSDPSNDVAIKPAIHNPEQEAYHDSQCGANCEE